MLHKEANLGNILRVSVFKNEGCHSLLKPLHVFISFWAHSLAVGFDAEHLKEWGKRTWGSCHTPSICFSGRWPHSFMCNSSAHAEWPTDLLTGHWKQESYANILQSEVEPFYNKDSHSRNLHLSTFVGLQILRNWTPQSLASVTLTGLKKLMANLDCRHLCCYGWQRTERPTSWHGECK